MRTIFVAITLLIAVHLPAQAKYTCSHYLDSISEKDTVELRCELSDLGEWGGHWEYIKLFKKEGKICFTYRKEAKSSFLWTRKPDSAQLGKGQLSKRGLRKVASWIDRMRAYVPEDHDPSNAIDHYEIHFKGKLVCSNVAFHDDDRFVKMRRRVFHYR